LVVTWFVFEVLLLRLLAAYFSGRQLILETLHPLMSNTSLLKEAINKGDIYKTT